MSEHDDAPERELEEMQAQADHLGQVISETREDWERKKADAAVPGAGGDPHAAEAEDPEATAYPAKGGDGSLGEGLDADEPVDPRDPETEDL